MLERDGKLAPERAIAILAQVASALDAAHRRGLVHRDVKPANVLLDEDGHVYLTDFGITKQLGGASTDTGQMVGTLDYLAPEQIRGDPVDGRTDSYSLACVLYECLAGAPPFQRETEAETLWAHMQEQPAPLGGYPSARPGAPRGARQGPREAPRELRRADRGGARRARPAQRPMADGVRASRLAVHRRTHLRRRVALLPSWLRSSIGLALTGDDSERGADRQRRGRDRPDRRRRRRVHRDRVRSPATSR